MKKQPAWLVPVLCAACFTAGTVFQTTMSYYKDRSRIDKVVSDYISATEESTLLKNAFCEAAREDAVRIDTVADKQAVKEICEIP